MIEVKLSQFWKAYSPIEVTPSEMVIEVKPTRNWKVPLPIEVTLLGMVIEVMSEQRLYLQIIVYQFVSIKTVEK